MSTTITFDERHKLDPDRPHNRESLVWVVTLPERQLGAVAYTWVDAFGKAGAAGIAFGPRLDSPIFERVDGVPVDDAPSFETWNVGGMSITHSGAEREARISYEGDRMSMTLDFTPMGVPYAYSSGPSPFPSYFADERLEQGGRAVGTITVDGETLEFDAFAHRDHSWGARDWGSTSHYKWLNFLGDGTSIHLMDLHGLGQTDVRGYVHKDGQTSEITDASFEYTLDSDMLHRDLVVSLEDAAGRSTRAALVDAGADITYPIDARLTLLDIVGRCDIDGSEGAAYVEMAWPPEYLAYGIEQRS